MARRGLKLIKCGPPICLKAGAACLATSFTTRVRPMQRRSKFSSRVPAPKKQLERTVIPRRVRAVGAPFHHAPTARWTARHAAALLRRYATNSGLSGEEEEA